MLLRLPLLLHVHSLTFSLLLYPLGLTSGPVHLCVLAFDCVASGQKSEQTEVGIVISPPSPCQPSGVIVSGFIPFSTITDLSGVPSPTASQQVQMAFCWHFLVHHLPSLIPYLQESSEVGEALSCLVRTQTSPGMSEHQPFLGFLFLESKLKFCNSRQLALHGSFCCPLAWGEQDSWMHSPNAELEGGEFP